MTPTQLEQYHRQLERLRSELAATDEAAHGAAAIVELDQSSVGRLSRMDALQGQAMARESQRRREIQLRRIDAALTRIAAGDFGVCLACGEDIDTRRLDLDPALSLCIDCAQGREKS